MLELVDQLASMMPTGLSGSVVRTVGTTAAVADFPAPVGAVVEIERQNGQHVRGEVVGFRDDLTIVIVTHNMQQAARVSQRTGFFYMGRLVEVGETTQIFTRPRERETEDYITGRFG